MSTGLTLQGTVHPELSQSGDLVGYSFSVGVFNVAEWVVGWKVLKN